MLSPIKTFSTFDLYQVSEHAYAAIKNNPLPMSNAGFVDLGGLTVIFDTFLSVEAADECKRAAAEIGGHEHFVVVNSHGHLDHVVGNCLYPDGTPIIASAEAREGVLKEGAQVKFGHRFIAAQIEKLEASLAETTGADEKANIENDLIFYRNFSDPRGSIVAPNTTFTGTLALNGAAGQFDLQRVEIAHAPGDVYGILAAERVAFTGDLLFTGEHPWIGSGDPFALRDTLRGLLDSDIECFVPGHGPLGGKAQVQEQIDYLDAIIALVKEHIDAPEKIQSKDLPQAFHGYGGPCFRWNVDFLAKRLRG